MNTISAEANTAIELLADMVCSFLKREKKWENVKRIVRHWDEEEAYVEMDCELTAELLGTPNFRVVA